MIGLMPKTNCSSSTLVLFGWLIRGEQCQHIASHVQGLYPQNGALFWVYECDGVAVAIAREEIAIGHRGSFCASEQFVSELVSSTLRILRGALGELAVKRAEGSGYIELQSGEVRISSPGLILFNAGNAGYGLLGFVYGVRSMQIDNKDVPLPIEEESLA